jgi:hypothetical protein
MSISLIGFRMFHFLLFGPRGMFYSTHNVLDLVLRILSICFFVKIKVKIYQ